MDKVSTQIQGRIPGHVQTAFSTAAAFTSLPGNHLLTADVSFMLQTSPSFICRLTGRDERRLSGYCRAVFCNVSPPRSDYATFIRLCTVNPSEDLRIICCRHKQLESQLTSHFCWTSFKSTVGGTGMFLCTEYRFQIKGLMCSLLFLERSYLLMYFLLF